MGNVLSAPSAANGLQGNAHVTVALTDLRLGGPRFLDTPIEPTASISSAMEAIRDASRCEDLWSRFFCKFDVEIGQIQALAPHNPPPRILPDDSKLDKLLTHFFRQALTPALPQNQDSDVELGGVDPLTFTEQYRNLVDRPPADAVAASVSLLIVRKGVRQSIKSAILASAMMIAVTVGLVVGLTNGNVIWGLGTVGAGVAIVGIVVAAYWAK